jgi:hypothetical protein
MVLSSGIAKFYAIIGVPSKDLKLLMKNSIRSIENISKKAIRLAVFGSSSMISTDCWRSSQRNSTSPYKQRDPATLIMLS